MSSHARFPRVGRVALFICVLVVGVPVLVAQAPPPRELNGGPMFLVFIEGLSTGMFREVSGLSAEVQVLEYREGGNNEFVRKLPGVTKWPNIMLKREFSPGDEVWEWFQKSLAGQHDPRNGWIQVMDRQGTPIAKYKFRSAWIAKWTGPTLNAKSGGDIAIETLELAHEGLELDDDDDDRR